MLIRNQKGLSLFFAALKHAYLTNKLTFVYPYSSNFLYKFLNILAKTGIISGWSPVQQQNFKEIRVTLRYLKVGSPVVSTFKFYSCPGREKFFSLYQLSAYLVLYPSDTIILSTPRGLLTGDQAQQMKTGGKVLCCFR